MCFTHKKKKKKKKTNTKKKKKGKKKKKKAKRKKEKKFLKEKNMAFPLGNVNGITPHSKIKTYIC